VIAAIYARKSTEQNVAEESKSVTRQVENARAFAVTKGWTVADEHIWIDDARSGAEFERRPGLVQMMGTLTPKAPFQVLIVSESKSLGREMSQTAYLIKQLDEARVEVWGYLEDRCLTPRDPMAKLLSNVQGFSDEDHRVKSSLRVHEAARRRAEQGYVTGGRCYGYGNKHIFSGVDKDNNPKRSHVERVIDESEARWVRRAFELYASGLGLKLVAKKLTSESGQRFQPSNVRKILGREAYAGVVVWNKSRKRNSWGKVDPTVRPESEWVRTPAEHLRIVAQDLWLRVASRRQDVEGRTVRFESGRLSGRPPKNAARNLLAGLATCGVCGSGLVVETGLRQVPKYACHRRRHVGDCANNLRVSVDLMNEAVLVAVEEHALTPEAIEHVIQLTERSEVQDVRARFERELKENERRIGRLLAAIESGGDAPALVDRVRKLEARQQQIKEELAGLRPVPRLAPAVVEKRLTEWRRLLRQSVTQGRAVLQRVLRGRLTFTPLAGGAGYEFTGPTRFDKLFTGFVVGRPAFLTDGDRRGTEHIRPEDTLDLDYGRLLEKAHGIGVLTPRRR
jgi:site-specific DNA recombinase